jgi:hypothetical protein
MRLFKLDGTNAYKVVHEQPRPETVDMPSPEEMHEEQESLQRIAIRAAYAKESYREADARLKRAELARANGWLRPEPKQPWVPRALIGLLGAIAFVLALALAATSVRPTLSRGGRVAAADYPSPAPAVGQGRAP